MSEVLNKIKSRGYWEVLIRPAKFVENLIESLGRCKEIIRDLSVQWRGLYYPYYSFKNPPTNGIDYIEQSVDLQQYLEFWRYYQSGQFIHFFGMVGDWQDQVTERSKINLKPCEVLDVIDTLLTCPLIIGP